MRTNTIKIKTIFNNISAPVGIKSSKIFMDRMSIDIDSKKLLAEFADTYNFARKNSQQWKIKRAMDYAGAVVLLAASLPIMITSGILIKLNSKGPIIFKQKRVGHMGKDFTIYKFRTMYNNASSNPVKYGEKDARITRVGKILRKFSIDELPQLVNILKGEMSLIGPRPVRMQEIKEFQEINPHSIRRLATLPGASINYNEKKYPSNQDYLKFEKEYLDNWSLKNDFKILAGIIKKMLNGKNY